MATRDPAADRAHALAALDRLLTADGHMVRTGAFHLLASSTDHRIVEVWCQTRTDGQLWFTHAGGAPICPADQPETARQAVRAALTPPAISGDGPIDLTALTRSLEADLRSPLPRLAHHPRDHRPLECHLPRLGHPLRHHRHRTRRPTHPPRTCPPVASDADGSSVPVAVSVAVNNRNQPATLRTTTR
jgi:hypothetical protein